MNRRGFLKLLGFGLPAALIAPKVFSSELMFPDKAVIPKTNAEFSEPWFAPAGFRRGTLDRINEAQLLAKIKHAMEDALQRNIYEPNDALTRNRIQADISGHLNYFKQQRVITDYVAICNDANNPSYRIEQGFVNLDVSIQPVRSIKTINLVATMERSSVSFTEFREPDNEIARRFT